MSDKVISDIKKKISLRKKVKKKKGTACIYCGCDNALLATIDHRKARSRGGKDTVRNLYPVCVVCNKLKGSLSHIDMKDYMKALKILRRLQKVRLFFIEDDIRLEFYPERYPKLRYEVEDSGDSGDDGDD